jgi:signal peptidase I
MKKVKKIASSTITILLFVLLIFMIVVVISSKASGGEPQFLGYQLKSVLSGSMEPTFKTGSIIAVKPVRDTSNLKKHDIITYIVPEEQLVTHRIIDVIKKGEHLMFQTKGDNNEDPDGELVLSQNVVARYSGLTIPYVGYITNFARSSKGTASLLIVPGVLLLIYSGVTIKKGLKDLEKDKGSDLHETF